MERYENLRHRQTKNQTIPAVEQFSQNLFCVFMMSTYFNRSLKKNIHSKPIQQLYAPTTLFCQVHRCGCEDWIRSPLCAACNVDIIHMTYVVEKSQDLPLASWGPKGISSVVSIWVQRPKNQESWQFQSESHNFKTQEELMLQLKPEGKKRTWKARGKALLAFLLYLGLRLIGWGPLTLRRTIRFSLWTDGFEF